MKKYVFKEAWLNLVLGVALIVFAILASRFVLDLLPGIINYAIAAVIIFYSVLNFFRHRKKYKNSHAFMILVAVMAIGILLAVLLILPDIGLGVNVAIGLVLYVNGLSYLLIMQLTKQRSNFATFVIYLAVLTLGAYVLFGSPALNDIIEWVLLAILVAYGIVLVFAGVDTLRKKK